jgi:transposase-like protein
MSENVPQKLNKVIKIDEEKIHQHLGELVRGTVEETLNKLLDAEADQLCNAARYERTEARKDTRAGHYQRSLHTKAGEVSLRVPKLREHKFETAIIERYRRRESSVEEALIEMYLAGVSVRRVEDITQALWGMRVSPALGAHHAGGQKTNARCRRFPGWELSLDARCSPPAPYCRNSLGNTTISEYEFVN